MGDLSGSQVSTYICSFLKSFTLNIANILSQNESSDIEITYNTIIFMALSLDTPALHLSLLRSYAGIMKAVSEIFYRS